MINLASGERPEQMLALAATPALPGMMCLGHPLTMGRLFLEAEGTPGRDQVTVLSYNLWQERFDGDPKLLGQAIRIDGKRYTVVGVLGKAPCDHLPWRLWIPLSPSICRCRTNGSRAPATSPRSTVNSGSG
jgi:putative ABC transport system permease protein